MEESMNIILTDTIFDDVLKERTRQGKIHKPFANEYEGMTVLMEEVGELAKAVYERSNVYEEAIQSMAVIVKYLQQYGVRK